VLTKSRHLQSTPDFERLLFALNRVPDTLSCICTLCVIMNQSHMMLSSRILWCEIPVPRATARNRTACLSRGSRSRQIDSAASGSHRISMPALCGQSPLPRQLQLSNTPMIIHSNFSHTNDRAITITGCASLPQRCCQSVTCMHMCATCASHS
jgi:hypothetical protein